MHSVPSFLLCNPVSERLRRIVRWHMLYLFYVLRCWPIPECVQRNKLCPRRLLYVRFGFCQRLIPIRFVSSLRSVVKGVSFAEISFLDQGYTQPCDTIHARIQRISICQHRNMRQFCCLVRFSWVCSSVRRGMFRICPNSHHLRKRRTGEHLYQR